MTLGMVDEALRGELGLEVVEVSAAVIVVGEGAVAR